MEAKKKKLRKVVSIIVLTIMLLSALLPTLQVFADDTVPSTGETNAKTTNMLSLFRQMAYDIDAGKVSEEEYRVYGVLISNYFIPGQTTVKDIKSDDIAKKVARSFLGDEAKYGVITDINNKLYEGITHMSDGLGSSTEYVLTDTTGNPINGEGFLKAIANGGKVNLKGKTVFNFDVDSGSKDAKALRGAMQILMGISPDLFIGLTKSGGFGLGSFKIGADKTVTGIGTMDRLFMDGVGNVWGSYKTESGTLEKDDYVLIMPGCLNPATFNINKVPVTNAFAMGAMLKVDSLALNDSTEGKINLLPYYNIKSKMGSNNSGTGDASNMINIYGIHSPTKYVGNTDGILKNGGRTVKGSELVKEVNNFATATSNSAYNESNLKVIFSLDMSKYGNFKSNVKEIFPTQKERNAFSDYFCTNIVYAMSELSQDMYFFSSSGSTGDSNVGDFTSNDSLVKKHKMFAYYDGSGYRFYANGLKRTSISAFLSSNNLSTLTLDKVKNAFNISDDALGKEVLQFLQECKVGSNNSILTNDLHKVFKAMNNNSDSRLFSVALQANNVIDYDGILNAKGTVIGMAHKDKYLSIAQVGKVSEKLSSPFSSTAIDALNGKGLLQGGNANLNEQALLAELFHTLNTYNVFSIDSSISNALTGSAVGSAIKTPWGDSKIYNRIANEVNNWPGIYWGYVVSLLGGGIIDGEIKASGWSNSYLPSLTINTTGTLDFSDALTGSGLSASDDKTIEDMQKDIIRKIYGLLSEDDNSYRANLIATTIDGFILNTHRAIVGSWIGENFVVGTGKTYTSAVGYLSTPSLAELPLTSWLLDDYAMIYMFSLLLILMIIVVMVITNSRTVQEGLVLFLVMGVVLMIPQSLVVNVVNLTNSVTDKMYSNKFNYWAISQHHELVENGLKAGGSAESDMAYTMDLNKDFSSSDARVRIKWMSPKKEEEFDKLYKNESKLDGIQNNLVLAKFLMGNFMSQDEYIMNSDESYLYRPYSSIVNSAKNMYVEMGSNAADLSTLRANIQSGKNMISGVPSYRFDGLMGNIVANGNKTLMSKVDTYSVDSELKTDYRYWGLGNFGVTSSIFRDDYTIDDAGLTGYTDDAEYSAFLLMTESPYYYFYNVFKSRYSSINGGFKNALLESNVFKVSGTGTDADGELRDFLDLDGLFTNVVPYLKQANEYVDGWTSIYGSKIDTYDFENGGAGEEYQEQYESAKRKKDALKNVWMLYSPWVDGIYESAGKKERTKGFVMIDDPLNPGAYAQASSSRRMIFSPAEKEALGYNDYMLTDAEMRIQKVLKNTYKDLMYLINYYDFHDEVLLSMASMMATFNFNKEFSQYRLFGNSTIIYPQNFELKNFNFDAYMRLMIVNATGEPMKGDSDLYERMLSKTSVFTGLLLLLVDVLGVIVIPAVKLLALVLIFLLSVVIGFSCILVPTDKIGKRILDSLLKPLGLLMVALVGFSFVMSLFMGEGYTSYVGSKTPTLGITDPNILMLLIALVSCGYLYILLKIVGMIWKHLKNNGVATALGFVATAVSLGAVVAKNVRGGVDKVSRGIGYKGNSSSNSSYRGDNSSGANGNNSGLQDLRNDLNDDNDDYDLNKDRRYRDIGNNTPIEDSDSVDDLVSDIDALTKNRGNGNTNNRRSNKGDFKDSPSFDDSKYDSSYNSQNRNNRVDGKTSNNHSRESVLKDIREDSKDKK